MAWWLRRGKGEREERRERGGWSEWVAEGHPSEMCSPFESPLCPFPTLQSVKSTKGRKEWREGGRMEVLDVHGFLWKQ